MGTSTSALAWADVGLTWVIAGLGMATLLTSSPGQVATSTQAAALAGATEMSTAPFPIKGASPRHRAPWHPRHSHHPARVAGRRRHRITGPRRSRGAGPYRQGQAWLEVAQILMPASTACLSIAASSSGVKADRPAAARFSSSWATLLAPISAEVTR